MSNIFSSRSDMQALTALDRGDIGHDDSVNAFNHQLPSYQSSELLRPDSLAPLPYTFNDDETARFIGGANLEHVNLPMDLPNHLSTLDPSSQTVQPEGMAPTSYDSNDVAASVVTQSDLPKAWATEHDWTRHRALITQLYGENKLPEVMSIMESQKDFKATVKMYKTHIKKWGLDKKNKEPEMRAIVRKNKQRAEQGKRSNFRVRKRNLDFAEVVRYWERKGVTIDEVIAQSTASPTPEAVECFTVVSSPITPPEDLASPEYILRIIRGYIAASFESGTWVKTEPRFRCHSIKDTGIVKNTNILTNIYSLAIQSFSTHNPDEAERTLSAAFAMSRKVLLAEDPTAPELILDLIADLQCRNEHEIALRILRQFSAISKELLGESHPLCLFWAWLAAMPWSQIKDILSRCFHVMADDFQRIVGPMHVSTLNYSVTINELDFDLAKSQRLLDKCESALGSHDERTLFVRTWLMSCTSYEGHYAEAKRMGEDLLAYFQRNQGRVEPHWWSAVARKVIAVSQYALGKPHLAIPNLEVAIDILMGVADAQDGLIRKWLLTLEEWYIEQGHLSAATVVRDQRIKLMESTEIAQQDL